MKLLHFLTSYFNLTGKPEEHITMHRFGRIETNLVSANQCKSIGHTHYDYQVTLVCKNKLDEHGYLIDNRAVDKALKDGMKEMRSCEQLCLHFTDCLENTFRDKGVPLCSVHMVLKPIVPGVEYKDFAEFEFTRDYKN